MAAVYLILGLIILILGADLLVRGAASLAKRLAIAEIVIGLTVVAFGTSTPEMVVNIYASIQDRSDIVFGNIIGSNIFNILMILGISGLIYPLVVQKSTVWKEIPFSLLAVFALLLLVNSSVNSSLTYPMLSRSDGLILLLLFAVFITYLFGIAKVDSPDGYQVKVYSVAVSTLLIIGGLVALFAGGRFCVVGAVGLARSFGLSEKFIASTIIAAGTSLPELATSAVAAYRKRCDLAVGNIIGSNIFNILLILGTSAVIHPVRYDPAFNIDLAILIVATVILYIAMFTGKKQRLDRWEAALMLLGYSAYVIYLVYNK